ncbi:hypothetical protein E3T55_09940 [Cryobacterium frigoriphilum]|uniref:Histidine kinase domain-containing protein n=1 Tax=Cryobacterium frigoriphilum TaxID=1259150 RepID=A0A4R9A128_9MICO|nr:ATP-binding protein [Cryobacterium frigoriphilum]TFD50217.1 hypothetical protein E3T55_09940 [Cryobacterium frigoriphilum]
MLQDPNVSPSASAASAGSERPAGGPSEPPAQAGSPDLTDAEAGTEADTGDVAVPGSEAIPPPSTTSPSTTSPSTPSPSTPPTSTPPPATPARSGLRAGLRRLFGRAPVAPAAHREGDRSPTTGNLVSSDSVSGTRVAVTPGALGASPDARLTALLAERELALGGIREGVIAVDSRGLVTRLNETARLLLGLPTAAVGTSLTDLGFDAGAVHALSARGSDDRDRACVAAGRMLVLNQVTVQPLRGRSETVTTLRDRTELVTLRLPGASTPGPMQLPSPSDQTDEFTHRVHTVEVLARLGTTSVSAGSADYLAAICAEQRGPLTRIMDPLVAALLIKRTAVVSARGAALRLTVDSELPRLDPATSADVVTVLGILLDNALDSVEGSTVRQLTVQIDTLAAGSDAPLAARLVEVRVRVHDTGPGIAAGLIDHIFEVERVTQAPVRHRADPGFGLAIVQLIATRRGGSVGYEFADGAAFDTVLPVRPAPAPV